MNKKQRTISLVEQRFIYEINAYGSIIERYPYRISQ